MKISVRLATIFGVLLVALTVSAHEQKVSITRVQFNERTGNLEVMHRFSIHDVEHASPVLFGRSANVLDNESDRQQFADYVFSRFSLVDQHGVELPLEPVGHELEDRFLWVYAETKIPQQLSKLTVFHEALLEVWPTQSNLVNVQMGNTVKSATFVRGSEPVTIEISK